MVINHLHPLGAHPPSSSDCSKSWGGWPHGKEILTRGAPARRSLNTCRRFFFGGVLDLEIARKVLENFLVLMIFKPRKLKNVPEKGTISIGHTWVFPKIWENHPNHPILIGFSIIFTIHFGVFPLFLETPTSEPTNHWNFQGTNS